jgi:cytoskeletal protein CcmA (bactofilin family)
MFSKTPSDGPQGGDSELPSTDASIQALRRAGQKQGSLFASDMTLEGNVTGGGELQIDGVIKGDVRVERVTVNQSGQVDGGIFADAVEVRGKVTGSITAKEVRLYDACHVDGDITHQQLSVEPGAYFQGRSMRSQKPAATAHAAPPAQVAAQPAAAVQRSEPSLAAHKDTPIAAKDSTNGQAAKAPTSPFRTA